MIAVALLIVLVVVVAVVAVMRRGGKGRTMPSGAHRCAVCGSDRVGGTDGLVGAGENAACLLLLFFGLIPGVIYYVVQSGKPYCSGHRKRILPQQMLADALPVDAVGVTVEPPKQAPGFRSTT